MNFNRDHFNNLDPIIKTMLDRCQDIIYYLQTQPEMKFLYINEAATKITGYTPSDHYQNPNLGFEIVHPDDRHILKEILAAEGGFDVPIELRWVKKNGTASWT